MAKNAKSFEVELSEVDIQERVDLNDESENINQIENIASQFQNDSIFNNRESNLVSSTLFENKLKVFSYNQRKTEHLPNLLASGTYENIIRKVFENSNITLQNFIVFSDKLKLANEISDNVINFFNSIDDISKAAEINSKNFELLNYSNIVKDFFKFGSSNIIGKIFKKANDNFRNIVVNNTKKYEDIKLTIEQDAVFEIKNNSLINNKSFQKKFMQINTRPDSIRSDTEHSGFIYNTDKMMTQIHLNYIQSEKFLCPNSLNSNDVEENTILYIEDYPILEIGRRLTNGIDLNKYITSKGNVKINSIRKDIKNNSLQILDTSTVISKNSIDTCKFIGYRNLYNTYYPTNTTIFISPDTNNNDFVADGLRLQIVDSDRIYDQSLSNTIFLTDCRIKYGSTNTSENTGRDITDITRMGDIPLTYFTTVGNYFKSLSEVSEFDDTFNLVYLTFHTPSSDQEVVPSNELYMSTRRIPFTAKRNFDQGTTTSRIEDSIRNIISLFESTLSEYSLDVDTNDILSINRYTENVVTANNTVFNAYSNFNSNMISILSYLQNILIFFEKLDRVIDTYSIGSSLEMYDRFTRSETSNSNRERSRNRKLIKVIVIKARLETISKNITSALSKSNSIFSRLRSLNHENISSLELDVILIELNKIFIYFEKVNILLKRLFERFVKIQIDESTGNGILEDGDFKLSRIIREFDVIEGNNYRYYYRNPDDFNSTPEDFMSFVNEKLFLGDNLYVDKNKITSEDLYEEGGNYSYAKDLYGELIPLDRVNLLRGSISCNAQFSWHENHTGTDYPRIYDYIFNSIYSILYGSKSEEEFVNYAIAGQFRDIRQEDSIVYLTQELNREILNFNTILSNVDVDSSNLIKPATSILDVHAFKYDSSVNKRVNSYLRKNYIEPCQNTLLDSTKIDLICSLNEIKKVKLAIEGIDIEELMPLASKARKRAISLQKEGKEIAFAYGNKDSENILLTLDDEEISTLIQQDTFTNNYRKDLLIDDTKIKTTNNLFSNQLEIEGNFEDIKNKILKISSLYYGNNTFKNNKTLLFRILQKINGYVNVHNQNWKRTINNPTYTNNDDRNQAYYDFDNKDYFCNFQYDSFITKLFSGDVSYDESKDFIKRFVAYSICSQTPFENKVTSLSEIDIQEEGKLVFNENLSEILKINKLNNNSKEINEFIYSNNSLNSVLKYSILEFKNPLEAYVQKKYNNPGSLNQNPNLQRFLAASFRSFYPLNLWSYKNFSQNKITFISSGYDYNPNPAEGSLSFFERFVENENFIYKSNTQEENIEEYDIEKSNKLNIPRKNDVNIIKNISIKKIFEQEDSGLIDQVRANSILEEDKTNDLVYKFRTSVKDKFWISKSYTTNDTPLSFETKETNPIEEEINSTSINDYNHDIPGLDMFYYSVNSGNKSIVSLFNDILIELLEYFDIDFDRFEDYASILSFVEEENKILNSVFNLFQTYCRIFKIVFDRFQSYFVYNFCYSLTKVNYTEYSGENYLYNDRIVKLKNIQINNVIDTFRMLPNLTSDIDRIYQYFVEEEFTSEELNNLENNFNNVSRNMEGLSVSLQDIGFESKDTDILLDLINSCHINDVVKSLNLDILYGYYKTLSDVNNLSEEINKETSFRLQNLRKYFLSSDYSFETCLNNNFYLNIVSKKMQNIFTANKHILDNFVDNDKDLEDNTYFNDLFLSLKEEKLNDINMLKYLFKKINETSYVQEKDNRGIISNNILIDQTFDFIKIGFEFDAVNNFSSDSLFKIDVYTFDHNTFDIEYTATGREKVKTFYYTPSLTSIPSCFFQDISSDQDKYIGYYSKTSSIRNRFKLLTKEEVINNIRTVINTTGVSQFTNLEADEYRFAESDDESSASYTSKIGSKIFSDHYMSMFCEYYEKLINNVTSENFFDKFDSLADRVLLESFYNEMTSMNDSSFINIFEISKDDLILDKKGNNFRIITPKSVEVMSKNRAGTFMEHLSKSKTDVDLYKMMHVNKYYDFFNIILKAPENKNVTYALKVEVL